MAIKWSAQQEAIFQWMKYGKGHLVVEARAGTGKTTTMVEGVQFAPETKILLAAFNKSIATELQSRVKHPGAECKTLHSLGYSYLRRYWPQARIDDNRDHDMEMAMEAAGTQAPAEMLKLVKKLASAGKNALPFPDVEDMKDLALEFDCEPDEEWEEDGWDLERVARCAMKAMDLAASKNDGCISFDDMVFVPVRNKWVRGWFDLVVIDEAQDMNASQLILARGACKPTGRIVVIGDSRQAIYGFRGADSDSISRLKQELHATELKLTITRRCPKSVVALAAALVPDFEAAPEAPEGSITALNTDKLADAVQVGDFVLSRKNAPLASTCLKILRTGKRACVKGKDIGKGLVALVNKLAKGPAARSMPAFLAKLTVWEEKEVLRWKAQKKDAKVAETKDRAETIKVLAEGLTGVRELCSRIEGLFADNTAGSVVCSSIHRSKGLEANRVFILRDTLYPGGRRHEIEEQNLEYVAITRSKGTLTWVDDGAKAGAAVAPAAVPAPTLAAAFGPAALDLPADGMAALHREHSLQQDEQ